MTLNFSPIKFKSPITGGDIKIKKPKSSTGDSDYIQNLLKQYESTMGKVSGQGLPTEEPETFLGKAKKLGGQTLTGLMTLLMSMERGISAFATELVSSYTDYPVEKRKKMSLAENYKVQWNAVSESLKAVFNQSEKYKDWSWTKFFDKVIPKLSKEFSGSKRYLENPVMKKAAKVPGMEWTKQKWTWLVPILNGIKMTDLLVYLGVDATKSPNAILGLIAGIVLDPTTYISMGFGPAVKAPLKVGKEVAEETAEALGKGAVRKLAGELSETGGKVILSKAGQMARGTAKDIARGLIPETTIGRKIISEAQEDFLQSAIKKGSKLFGQKPITATGTYAFGKVPGIPETSGLPALYKGLKAVPEYIPGSVSPFATNASEKIFAKAAGEEALEKAAYKIAESEVGRSLLTKAGKKFVDYGGIKFAGKTVVPVGFFDKVGFTKVADLLRNTRTAKFLAKAFTAQGTAPPELYESFRYNMDLLPTYQKRLVEDRLRNVFNRVDKEAREDIAVYLSKPWKIQESRQFVVKRAPIKTQVIEEVTKRVNLSDVDKARLSRVNKLVSDLQQEIDTVVEKRINKLTAQALGVEDPIKELNKAVRYLGGIKRSKDYYSEYLEYPLFIRNKAGQPEDLMFQELTSSFPQLTSVLKINSADDLSQVLRYGKRTKLSGLFRHEDIYDETLTNWIAETPENLAKYSKLEKAEEVRSILVARLAEDPLGEFSGIGGYMDLIPERILKNIEIPKKYNTKLVTTEIQKEVTRYMDVITEVNKRVKLPTLQLSKQQKKIAGAFTESRKEILEMQRAWGLPIEEYPGYVPSFRPTGTISKKPFAISKEIGPEIPRQQLGKVFPNPLAAKKAGIPTEMDLAVIWYRSDAEAINAVARTRFLRDARKWGKTAEMLSPAQKLSYVKGTEISAREVGDLYFEPEIAAFLVRGKDFLQDEGTRNLIKVYENITNWWKTFATAPNPGFHFRNFYSNMWQLFLKDGARAFNPRVHAIAIAILDGNSGGNVKVLNRFYTFDELGEIANSNGIIGRGWLGYDVPEVIENELKFGLAGTKQKIKKGINIASREGALAKAGTKFGRSIENEARLVGFLNDFMRTGDVRFSVINTKHFMFDYGALSAAEKAIKRNIPFYTWTRKNIPLQFEQLFKQPGKYSAIPNVKEYVERLADKPEGYEENKPDYYKSLYAIATPLKDENGNMLVFNPNFAWQDLGKLNAKDMINMVNPLIKIIFELSFNEELFYGRDIEAYAGELVPAPGYLAPLNYLPEEFLKKIGVFKGVDPNTGDKILYIPARREYLSRQIPFLANIARALPQKETAATEAQLRSWLTGIKFFPYEPEKAKYYKTKEKMTNLQGLIDKYKKLGLWQEPEKGSEVNPMKGKLGELIEKGGSLLKNLQK